MAMGSGRSVLKMTFCSIFLTSFLFSSNISLGEAYGSHHQNGNITIKWDVMQWTPDGYVAVVNIYNFQNHRPIRAPGWTLGWTWAKKEVIWSMFGARITNQGDCSRFKENIPQCCKKDPAVIDLPPGTPYNMQLPNCCKGGVLKSWDQDSSKAASAFQVSVGAAGNTNKSVSIPRNFVMKAPSPAYTCGRGIIVKPTRFLTPDGKRVTQALMTWKVTCTYFKSPAQMTPTCSVSLSSSYNDTAVNRPT